MLADMSTDIAAARLLIHHAARLYDAGHPIAKEAAHAKLFTTDMAMKHVSNALQIHGGNGYSQDTGSSASSATCASRRSTRAPTRSSG